MNEKIKMERAVKLHEATEKIFEIIRDFDFYQVTVVFSHARKIWYEAQPAKPTEEPR